MFMSVSRFLCNTEYLFFLPGWLSVRVLATDFSIGQECPRPPVPVVQGSNAYSSAGVGKFSLGQELPTGVLDFRCK